MNPTNNSARQIVPYQMRKKLLKVKQIFFAVKVQGTERVLYLRSSATFFASITQSKNVCSQTFE